MKTVRAYLSKGVVACQKGFERVAAKANTSLEKQRLLQDENRRLREEYEKLKQESHVLGDQRAK
jgi:hypothetical protein